MLEEIKRLKAKNIYFLAVMSIFLFILFSCEDQSLELGLDDVWTTDNESNVIKLEYSKDIKLSDAFGNTLSFTIYSVSKELIDSYSEKNFDFIAKTIEDVKKVRVS